MLAPLLDAYAVEVVAWCIALIAYIGLGFAVWRIRGKRIRAVAIVACFTLFLPYLSIVQLPVEQVASHVEPMTAYAQSVNGGYPVYESDPKYFDSREWTSVAHQEDRATANSDGSLSEWADGWYVAHADTGYGKVISELLPGDAITVDGVPYLIKGRVLLSYLNLNPNDLYETLGKPDVILQTCCKEYEGDDQAIWYVWGEES